MENISRHQGINIGGVNPILFAFADEIKNFITTEELITTITLKTNKSWKSLYSSDGTIVMESKEEETPAGIKYTYQFDMMIPKDRVDVELALLEMNNRGVVLMAKDKNGTVRCFGEPDNPMRKKGKLTWPTDVEGYNGTKLTLFGEFSRPAGYIPSLYSEVPFAIPG